MVKWLRRNTATSFSYTVIVHSDRAYLPGIMSRLMRQYDMMECQNCKVSTFNCDLFVCSGCSKDANCTLPACYCGKSCQKRDWKEHMKVCPSKQGPCPAVDSWVDHYRLGHDKSWHRGDLELITWDHDDCGWGGVFKDESDELKRRFEEDFGRDPVRLIDDCDNAFRWTCCGLVAGVGVHGCDHHGDMDNDPCKCDFCRAGKPLPDAMYSKQTQEKKFLTLRRGPDPRSTSQFGLLNWGMRQSFRAATGVSDEND